MKRKRWGDNGFPCPSLWVKRNGIVSSPLIRIEKLNIVMHCMIKYTHLAEFIFNRKLYFNKKFNVLI